MGAATEPGPIESDPEYAQVLASEFDSLTPENRMKWKVSSPAAGQYDFAPADALVDFAEANDMRVRGHTLLWANPANLPAYVNAATSASELDALLVDHVAAMAGRYAGRIAQWDVVNEAVSDTGFALRDNVFVQNFGVDYIARAFRLAHAVDPDAELFLNDYLIEYSGPKFNYLYDLVSDLLAEGVPIDGVGFQGHFFLLPSVPDQLEANMRAFSDLGLKVEITELDFSLGLFQGSERERLEAQRQAYFDVVQACLAVERCTGVTTWGVDDSKSWLNTQVGPGSRPLLFDGDLERKPAYTGFRDALIQVPEAGTVWLMPMLLVAGRVIASPACRRRSTRGAAPVANDGV